MKTTVLAAGSGLTSAETAAIDAFVSSVNRSELAPLAGLFAADAQVNDQLRNFWGRDAISGWLAREIIGEHVRLAVRGVRKHYDVLIVDTELSGDFAPGVPQPLIVDFYFTVLDAKIVRLLVLLAGHDGTEPEVRRLA